MPIRKAARRVMEMANSSKPAERGKIHIELVNYPMFFKDGATPAKYWAGLQLAIKMGWPTRTAIPGRYCSRRSRAWR